MQPSRYETMVAWVPQLRCSEADGFRTCPGEGADENVVTDELPSREVHEGS